MEKIQVIKKIKRHYDYLIVGAGLAGCIFAYEASKKGKKCLVIDKRNHVGGNLYCEDIEGIRVHKYGAHIFRTNDDEVWKYINRFLTFNHFVNSPIANYKGKLYNLPFNMNTFYQIYKAKTPEEAMKKIEKDKIYKSDPYSLEAHALSMVGKKIYKMLIKGYTEKQWGKDCKDLPKSIMRRIPLRFTFDNNYFNSKYQGIPIEGYNVLFVKLLKNCHVKLNVDYNIERYLFDGVADKVVYTGALDEYYNYCYGELEYRGLKFENKVLNMKNFQGNAVVNYTERKVPYTRIIEHKHFEFGEQDKTVITYEFPLKWKRGHEKYYPINDERNNKLYMKYYKKALKDGLILCGRLAMYRYYDMQDVIKDTLELCKQIL